MLMIKVILHYSIEPVSFKVNTCVRRINQVKLNPPKIYSEPNNTETLVDQPSATLNTINAAFDILIRPLKSG